MTDTRQTFLDNWHQLVANQDLDALQDILAEDVSMGAPPYWDELQGRAIVHYLLGLIISTIEDFTYHRQWHSDSRGENEIALEFKGHVGEMNLQGVDLITLNDRGQLQHLDVMIRPMNALEALRDVIAPQMIEFISQS